MQGDKRHSDILVERKRGSSTICWIGSWPVTVHCWASAPDPADPNFTIFTLRDFIEHCNLEGERKEARPARLR